MKVFRIDMSVYVVAGHQPSALAQGRALFDAAKLHGIEPGSSRVVEVPDADHDDLPITVRRLLERETRGQYGPAASMQELVDMRAALLAANGGQMDPVEDEIRATEKAFGYMPRALARERTDRALERATAPEAATA